ncbi:GntR family transcriptional regulator [Candidatus Terasakiella magnetica]|uniref:GntR family transcriptional regulator n=1 Tax=Candidatus Terasakiella magnetica TaxID=1867952 RepID=A0A1C3RKL4_9PROT|nr:PLP-dependent aminotransferase family protein [Candidatus Terasakiella magnetica]SCA57807.1 GntR family transcriptional regulator [Candidatus Terasakiella magnetica]
MSGWVPQIEDRRGPRYLAIADAIGEAIRDGSLQPEERLPTHRDLAYDLGVTVGTVSRAYAEAVRRDYVIGEVGRGTYVKPENEPDNPFHIPYDVEPDIYDFSLNFPAEEGRVELLSKALMGVAQDPGLGALMRYQSEQGMEHHRQAMAKWAAHHGAPNDPERIVVSNGVQHAMTLSLMALSKAGDTLLCEEYSYPGIKTLATQLGLKMQGLPMDGEGIIPEKLEEAIVQTGARMLYCMPNFQNPTNVVMGLDRRKEIALIAKKYGVWIIEDDIYGFLHDDPSAHTPFASLLPEQTFYLNGASKCVSPGVRVGFVLAPKQKVSTVAACMRLSSWMAAPLNVELTARWIEDGTVFDLMEWHRGEAQSRQAVMNKALQGQDFLSLQGTYHAWLRLPAPWSAEMFCLRARERDVSILPAHVFHIGKKQPENAVRICYGSPPNLDHVEEGMSRLATLLSEEIHAFHNVM